MNANQIISALSFAEVSSQYDAETRRMMRDERETLTAAARSGDAVRISAAAEEARRVAKMWGVDLG